MSRGLPDYPAGLFSSTRLSKVLDTRGAVLLRQLIPAALCQLWLPRFEAFFADTDQRAQKGTLSEHEHSNFYQFGHPVLDLDGPSPAQLELWSWWRTLLQQPAIRHLLRARFGPTACVLTGHSLPRRQRPEHPEYGLPFHQDCEYLGGLNQGVNLWCPLTPAGDTAPGLEIWLDLPQQDILHFGQESSARLATLENLTGQRWQPHLSPGDVLIFTPYTLHRSRIQAKMTQARYSYEFRLCPVEYQKLSDCPMIECNL